MASGLPLRADIAQCSRHVRFVPTRDSRTAAMPGISTSSKGLVQAIILGNQTREAWLRTREPPSTPDSFIALTARSCKVAARRPDVGAKSRGHRRRDLRARNRLNRDQTAHAARWKTVQ